ncbi:MAG: hypothetical protein WD988_01480 [Candidatus Curtissbacteria bacterium]
MALDTQTETQVKPVQTPLEKPTGTPLPETARAYPPPPHTLETIARPRPKIYEGNTNKMDVLNWGESGQDRAIELKLRLGQQHDALVFGIDPKMGRRILNLEDSRLVENMTEADLKTTAILQKNQDGTLTISKAELEQVVTPDQLKEKSVVIPLNTQIGLEVLGFDPENGSVIVHKVDLKTGGIPVIPPTREVDVPSWGKKLVTFLGPPIAAVVIGTGIGSQPPEAPPNPIMAPASLTYPEAPAPPPAETIQLQTPELDESLKCESTQEYEIKSGDSLTKALVDVNGLDRYLNSEGKLDVDKLYKDLACLLAISANQSALESSDPTVANFVKDMFSEKTRALIGPPTAQRILDGFEELNAPNGKERHPGSSSQLVITQSGQIFQIPQFSKE